MPNVGDTGAPSNLTIYYDSLLSTTLMAYRKQLYDNIFMESAFLAYMRKVAGAVQDQNGGERIAMPLMYGSNSTVKTVGGYEVIDTTPQDGLTTAFYPWAEIAGTITISRREERQNTGEGRLLNLLQAKIKQAEMTMAEKLNVDLVCGTVSSSTFVPETSFGGGYYGLQPLGYFFRKLNATDPTTGGDVGNIAGDTYSWWRHHTSACDGNSDTGNSFSINCSTFAILKIGMRKMYDYCSRGTGGSPDLVVCDQHTYEEYEEALDAKVRYNNTKMADLGFDSIKLRGATMLWDQAVPDLDNGYAYDSSSWGDGTAFFINTDFYKIIVDSETDIVTTPFIEPENQTARVAKILFMGNSAVSNMRKHGVMYDIVDTMTS